MIEKMYKENLKANIKELERLTFPELIRFCRELLGLKQYACAQYLGFKKPRYQKLELGYFSEPIEAWEMERLEQFFKLPPKLLQKKQKRYLRRSVDERLQTGKSLWNATHATAGARNTRAGGNYKRVRGTLD